MCWENDKERSEMMKSPTDTRPEGHQSSLSQKRRANKSKSKAEMMIHLLRLEKDRSRLVQKCKALEETAHSTQAAYIQFRATFLMDASFLRTRMGMLEEDTGYLKEKADSLQAKFLELNIESASKQYRINILESAIQEKTPKALKSNGREPPTTKNMKHSTQQTLGESSDDDLSVSTVSSTLRTWEEEDSSHTPCGFEDDMYFGDFVYASATS
jgi:hypothetical protein